MGDALVVAFVVIVLATVIVVGLVSYGRWARARDEERARQEQEHEEDRLDDRLRGGGGEKGPWAS